MSPRPSRYELTPEISRRLIAELNGKRAHAFREKKRQKVFLYSVKRIADEVERTGGKYPEREMAALQKIQAQAQELRSTVEGLSTRDDLELFMNFWSVFEQQRKAAPKQTQKKASAVRFRAISRDPSKLVLIPEPRDAQPNQAEWPELGSTLPGSESFGPDDMLLMLIEAVELSLAKRARIPRMRRYPGQTPKSRMFARMLAQAFYSAFREVPGKAPDGVFGSILNYLLEQFDEQPVGEDSLHTIIGELFPGFKRTRRPKPPVTR